MAINTIARAQARTVSGHDAAVFTVGGADYIKLFQNVSATFDVDGVDANSVLDFDNYTLFRARGVTLDFSLVAEDDASIWELITLAVASQATLLAGYAVVLRHAIKGTQIGGTFLLTSARAEINDGLQSQSATMQSLGAVTHSDTELATTPPTARTTQNVTAYGRSAAVIGIGGVAGTENDYVNLFDSCSVEYAIQTVDAMAAIDSWHYPIPVLRRVTVNASRVLENPSDVAASLDWVTMAATETTSHVHIKPGTTCAKVLEGEFLVTNAKVDITDGVQKETITLVNQGTIGFA